MTPPPLDILVIQGTLECAPNINTALVMQLKLLLIEGSGKFLCGTPSAPFGVGGSLGGSLEIRLMADSSSKVMSRLSNRIVVFGELKLHAAEWRSWARLNATVMPGDNRSSCRADALAERRARRAHAVHLFRRLGGGRRAQRQHRHRRRRQAGDGARAVGRVRRWHGCAASSRVFYPHVGVSEVYNDRQIDMYSEVGLITRPISIKSPSGVGLILNGKNALAGERIGDKITAAPFYDFFPWDSMKCDDGEPVAVEHPDRGATEKFLFDGDCLQMPSNYHAVMQDDFQTIKYLPPREIPMGDTFTYRAVNETTITNGNTSYTEVGGLTILCAASSRILPSSATCLRPRTRRWPTRTSAGSRRAASSTCRSSASGWRTSRCASRRIPT